MYVKICGTLNNEPDTTVIECDRVRIYKDPEDREAKGVVFMLEITPTHTKGTLDCPIQWLVSGKKQVYLLNNDGKTIERLY